MDHIEAQIAPAIRCLVEAFDARQVILFGSRARGDHHPDSDVDLLAVVTDDSPIVDHEMRHQDPWTIAGVFEVFGVTSVRLLGVEGIVDIGADGPAAVVGTVVRSALMEGRLLFDRYDPRVCWPDATVPSSRLAPPKVLDDGRRLTVTGNLLAGGHERLRRAGGLPGISAAPEYPRDSSTCRNRPDPGMQCWDASNAAHRALWAVVAFLGYDRPWTRDLDRLVTYVPFAWRRITHLPVLSELSRWPPAQEIEIHLQPIREPMPEYAAQRLEEAREVVEAVEYELSAHGFTLDADPTTEVPSAA